MTVSFFAPGTPRPKGSKDQFGRESSRYVRGWMDTIVLMARAQARGRQLDPPYRVDREYLFPRGKTAKYPWPSSCDIDKLDRACFDALGEAKVILDDRHIVAGTGSKRYAEPGEQAGVHLVIETCPA